MLNWVFHQRLTLIGLDLELVLDRAMVIPEHKYLLFYLVNIEIYQIMYFIFNILIIINRHRNLNVKTIKKKKIHIKCFSL